MIDHRVDILAFGAHPDDVECAAGGTLAAETRQGYQTAIVDLTRGELGSFGSPEIRNAEALKAQELLHVSFRENLGMPDGFIVNNKENQLAVISMIRKYRPTIVLANALHDRHPDHQQAAKLVSSAAYLAGLRKIETFHEGEAQLPHRPAAVYHYIQDLLTEPDIVMDISQDFDHKMKAVQAYGSQFVHNNDVAHNGSKALLKQIEATNSIFGRAINVQYAEGFTVNRYIGTNNLLQLL